MVLFDPQSGLSYQPLLIPCVLLTEAQVEGAYGKTFKVMPERARYLEPGAAKTFVAMDEELRARGGRLAVTDMFRDPATSMARKRELAARKSPEHPNGLGYLVQPAGFSVHTFAAAVDANLHRTDAQAKAGVWPTGGGLVKLLGGVAQVHRFFERHNWWCHRLDDRNDNEVWHHNYDVERLRRPSDKSRAPAAERRVQELYGERLRPTVWQCQMMLRFMLRLYTDRIDDSAGPNTRLAVSKFQSAWDLPQTGKLDDRTKRVLTVTCHEKLVVPLPA